ncbi:MAG: anaerobic glycerol-3-phosphate dehydrogenase subunit C [Planctomycetota bacterium]|nr:anaerobic glycerol-3-phosphate dehydrogenase subunit C [Planctomycetota bacterium]
MTLSPAKVSPNAIEQALQGRIAGDLLTDRFSLTAYATAACIYKIMPAAVVVPKDAADVATAVQVAAELGLSVIPRGAGSGLCGQALGTGLVLDFTKYMNQVLEIDAEAKIVRVQPGAVTGRVNEALAPHGLMLGPDPSSEAFCTIGGNLGNNSSGSRGIRYGSMKDYVAWLDGVLADGSTVRLAPMSASDPPRAGRAAREDLLGRIVAGTRRLANDNADLIHRYQPHTSKNSAGYNVFEVLRDGTFDLTRLVVGCEGTLAVVVQAGLRVVPKPKERASVLLWFSDLESAGEAVSPVLALNPSACEIMERHFLDIVRTDGTVPKEYLPKEADTVLLVEFLTDSRAQNEASIAAVRRVILQERKLAFGAIDAYDPKEQERLWMVRKRAVQILQRLPGPTRITPFIEDVTVPPKNLVTYMKGLREIFERFGVEAAVYGHAGDSNLHARPLLDLRRAEDVARMKGMADAVAHLTVDLGGTISCEHGDGLTRSGFLELQFGELYGVMRQIKELWDPKGTLNPGKVITELRECYTGHLRMGPDFRVQVTGSALDRDPWATEIGRCHGCGTCRAYCPVYKVSGDEVATPRGKANLLRAVVAGDLTPEEMAGSKMKAIANLCYNCKTCLVECPSHVNVPALVLKHKQLLAERGRLGLRERMLLHVRPMGRMGSLVAPVANAVMGWHPVRCLLERLGGIRRDAPVPSFETDRIAEGQRVDVPVTRCSVAYFAGCFELFNESDIARATLAVLGALGCEVIIPTQRCCGIPKISAGNVKGALKDMRFNLGVLAPLVEAGYTVTSGCPSCVLTLTDDYPELAQDDDRGRLVAEHTKDLHTLILDLDEASDGRDKDLFNPWNGRRLAYHAPCHLRAAGKGDVPRRLLEKMLGLKFVVTNATCCGMGGTYGLKSKNAETSALIAKEAFDRIKASGAEAVVTSCGMCRTQLAAGTGLPVYHPMQLLAEALKGGSKLQVQSSK